jgi:hypothetical protein
MTTLNDLRDMGHYVFFIPLRDQECDVKEDHVLDHLVPRRYFDFLRGKRSIARFRQFVQRKRLEGKRVYVVIDDAELISPKEDAGFLGPLLEAHLHSGLQLIFVSGNDDADPAFRKSSGYRSRLKPIRFTPDPEPFAEALTKVGLDADEIKTVLAATGPNVGDVIRVLEQYHAFNGITAAVDNILDEDFETIHDSVAAVPSGLTSKDAWELLSTVAQDPAAAVYVGEGLSEEHKHRLLAVGKHLVDRHIISYVGPARFVWRRQALANAYQLRCKDIETAKVTENRGIIRTLRSWLW